MHIKKSFKPDIIFIDYLNICASVKIQGAANVNSYMYIKSIAEELRGLAVETNVPIMSATQTTRSGFVLQMWDLQIPQSHLDCQLLLTLCLHSSLSEELDALDQMVVKQLKNRYNDPTVFKRFVIGVDRSRMKLYDCEQEAQEELIDSAIDDSTPVFDRGRNDGQKRDFTDFKV